MRYQLVGLAAVSCLIALPLVAVLTGQDSRSLPPPDLVEPAAFIRTCSGMPRSPDRLKDDSQRQAFAICRDVSLVRDIATAASKVPNDVFDDPAQKALLRKRLVYFRDEMRTVRRVLERMNLGQDKGLLIKPSSWQVDLNSDGQVELWEKYFFAIPQRHDGPLEFKMPANDENYYREKYALEAQIRIDQSDVLWALSYHYFVESLLEMILAYTVIHDSSDYHADLYDRMAMRRSHELVLAGLRTSELARKSVLNEDDDLNEWLPSPRQKNSAFPIRLTDEDFKTWNVLIQHLIPLFEGKTLVVHSPYMRGILSSISKICGVGRGIDLSEIYKHPPARLGAGEKYFMYLCRSPDSSHPPSQLTKLLEKYSSQVQNDNVSGARMLKYLLWVN